MQNLQGAEIMEIHEIRKAIDGIVSDSAKSIEDRIAGVLTYRDELETSDKQEELKVDEICYASLIDMLKKENATMSNVEDLMQLYTLLAETFDEEESYPPIKEIAYEVIEMIRINMVPWEIIKETVPRLIDAVNDTVYHHTSYDLHLWLLKKAYEADDLTEEFKGRARRLLKLRILLDDSYLSERIFDRELLDGIASLFTQAELVKIILQPQIGHLRQDPVEFTYEWEDIYYEVEKRLDERFANAPRQMGFCFMYWNVKRELLKEEYGIDWKSPAQMNPRVMFD